MPTIVSRVEIYRSAGISEQCVRKLRSRLRRALASTKPLQTKRSGNFFPLQNFALSEVRRAARHHGRAADNRKRVIEVLRPVKRELEYSRPSTILDPFG
jgi:hypothetical protein